MPAGDDALVLLARARDPAALAAERERRAHDRRQADLARARARASRDVGRDRAARHAQAGGEHRLAEEVAVLGAADRVVAGADQLDAVALERAVLVQRRARGSARSGRRASAAARRGARAR